MRTARTTVFSLLALAAVLRAATPAASEGAAGGVRWSVPAGWTPAPEKPMRVATYAIPAQSGQEAGECGVFFFGRGQGGSVEDNLTRWKSQFEPAPSAKPTVQTIHGLKVHQLDLSGTYLAPAGPMMQSQGKKANWRLLGAIIEAPDGLVFFKCTGPAATMGKAEKDFAALVQSVSKAAKA
jgi:hypothetical protein